MWKFTDASETVVMRTTDDGIMESSLVTREDVQAWIAEGNTIKKASEE